MRFASSYMLLLLRAARALQPALAASPRRGLCASAVMNPLLEQDGLPKFASIKEEHVEPAVSTILEDLDANLQSLEASLSKGATYEDTVEALEKISAPLGYAWGVVGHLKGVKDSEDLRAAHAAMQPKVVEATQKLGQSRKVYEALEGLGDSLSPTRKRVVDANLRSMRLGGVALEGAAKDEYNKNQVRLSELSTAFSNNVLDATKAFELVVTDAADVEGLPPSAKGAAAEKAASADKCEKADADNGPWLLGLDAPSYIPAMQHLKSSALREKLYEAFVTRAGDVNAPLIDEILTLKGEQAKLLGFGTYADVSLQAKMASSVAEIEELHELLAAKATPAAKAELENLEAYAAKNGHAGALEHWDVPFWAERLREEKFAFSEEELRPYFALPAVLDGLFGVIGRLFGVTVAAADGKADTWWDDVRYFEISDAAGDVVASFYLDPYSRPENKRGGAWMDVCIGRSKALGRGVPTAYLTCNGSPPVGDKPSLMTFNEVETLYHEMGHGLQHMLTKVEDGDAAGINGVEWDAVELPSQFMENWLLDKPTLYGFAKHYETGEPLPEEFYEKLKGSKTFHAGLGMTRQIAFGMLDVELHRGGYDPSSSETVFDVQKRIFDKYLAMAPRDYDRFLCAFGHIFAGGYSCGYYSYKWAEVLSADAFAAFEEAGLENEAAVKELGMKFRDTVLACGGGTPPAEVFEAFRGRGPSPEALLRHSGLSD
mmetsp:Transcript_14133/g.43681  ORF Transcript_14133/g.43681 Transcript_14133/m.43681 type:complete len:716 (-) Transcript_14133:69-2216(-)